MGQDVCPGPHIYVCMGVCTWAGDPAGCSLSAGWGWFPQVQPCLCPFEFSYMGGGQTLTLGPPQAEQLHRAEHLLQAHPETQASAAETAPAADRPGRCGLRRCGPGRCEPGKCGPGRCEYCRCVPGRCELGRCEPGSSRPVRLGPGRCESCRCGLAGVNQSGVD